MNVHIPYLEGALLLGAIIFPSGIGANLSLFLTPRQKRSLGMNLLGMVAGYLLIITLIAIAKPDYVFAYRAPFTPWLYILAPLLGVFSLFMEYIVGVLLVRIQSGKLITRIVVHSSYANPPRISIFEIILVLVFVICEELVLRQILFSLLLDSFAMPIWPVIGFVTLIYAINHITFGPQSVITKLFSGAIYSTAYYLSGFALIIPILGHMTQNLTLLLIRGINAND
ncbi:MAG: CPBP family intramembrane metalloprotease [Chloroflexi bacterium]|nr:CPBP family intramembrane metalloprotease [Chloroflexota bacterium]